MLRIQLMKPHKPHPISRRIDVDISEILLGPENVQTSEISTTTVFDRAFSNQADPSRSVRGSRVGPFAWISLNFVAVCSLIAVFCTIFIRDTFEYSRRNAHLPTDVSDLTPESPSKTWQTLGLEPSRLASTVQLADRQVSSPEGRALSPSQERTFATPQQFHAAQPLTSLPNNNTGLADRTSSSSKSISSDSAPPASVSRATSSISGSSSSGESSSSGHSTMRRAIRSSSKSTISARKTISSPRLNIHNSGAARSSLRSARQNLNSIAIGSRHEQAKVANLGSVMSMHSLGAGSAVRQIHGATNPMRMEGGLLAQPGIGAGLGGVSGNGLGGGGGGNRGGNRVAR